MTRRLEIVGNWDLCQWLCTVEWDKFIIETLIGKDEENCHHGVFIGRLLSRHFTGRTEDNHEIPRIKPNDSRIHVTRITVHFSSIQWGWELRASRNGHSFTLGHSVGDVNERAEPISPTPTYTQVGFGFTVLHYVAPTGNSEAP